MNPKKGYYNVIYEKQGPTPPRENRPIYSKLDEHAKVKRKSKTYLSLFGLNSKNLKFTSYYSQLF